MGFFAALFDPTLSDENIAKAQRAGFSEFEWTNTFTKTLRQLSVDDPLFGTVAIVASQQATGSPAVAGVKAFATGVASDVSAIVPTLPDLVSTLKAWAPRIIVGVVAVAALLVFVSGRAKRG